MPLCFFGAEALRVHCTDIAVVDDRIRELAERMIATMRGSEGIGLAAPQVGEDVTLVVLDIPNDLGEVPRFVSPGEMALVPQMPLVLVNPKLSNPSPETSMYCEGCLSIPGVNADVERPVFVDLAAETLDGGRLEYRCGGLLSRCLQHEVDHLNGVLFTDHLAPEALEPFADTLRKLEQGSGVRRRRGLRR